MKINVEQFKEDYKKRLLLLFSQTPETASAQDKYLTLGKLIRDYILTQWNETNKYYEENKCKNVYYFSMEFLLGKLLNSYLLNLNIRECVKSGLNDLGINLDDLLELDPEPALGNGGLGRLAACFMDSLAFLGFPAHGYGIRYKYGLFKQEILNGYQHELLNNWLKNDFIWEIKRPEESIDIKFGGYAFLNSIDGELKAEYHNYDIVKAVPYDIPIVGQNSGVVNTLKLFSAELPDSDMPLDIQKEELQKYLDKKFEVESISQVLYPNDSSYEGKLLRLKQEYFFVSAGLQSIFKSFKLLNEPITKFHDYIAIHINDTHPAVAVAELMRILVDCENIPWDVAWSITTQTIAYTNHTILAEAMEKWPYEMFQKTLPRIYMIIEEIDRRFCQEVNVKYNNDENKLNSMRIIYNNEIRMANLAIIGSHSVNGVARIHSEILKNRELHDFYLFYPLKFNNKTNGITHRRWLENANPELFKLVVDKCGEYSLKNTTKFINLLKCVNDDKTLNDLNTIKLNNKKKAVKYVKRHNNLDINVYSIFDVQIKRLHAYKRQLLNIFHIIYLYNKLKENPELDIVPRTFFFGAKAAPSYIFAKNCIKLINSIADVINNDTSIGNKIKVVFLENYNISVAEMIIPAGDVSEQISTASKEASGTGNMKFMMNGAITLATLDGANVEIAEKVEKNNIVVFGLTAEEVMEYEKNNSYDYSQILNNHKILQKIISQLSDGTFSKDKHEFDPILNYIYIEKDPYFVLKDFDSYVLAQEKINSLYSNHRTWLQMCLVNIANSGAFSSDITIKKYAQNIWHIEEVNLLERNK